MVKANKDNCSATSTVMESESSSMGGKEKRFNFLLAFQRIFKRLVAKDYKEEQLLENSCYNDEIEQNKANELLLESLAERELHQCYVMAVETPMGLFYWKCSLQ